MDKDFSKDGIEKLKKIGLKEVSNKTFINKENLEYLLNREFKKLHKTQALGFIQILEREFDVDLKNLKNDYIYFKKHGRLRSPNETKISNEKQTDITKSPKNLQKPKSQQRRRTQHTPLSSQKSPIVKFAPFLILSLISLLGYFLIKSAFDDKTIEIKDINDSKIATKVQDTKTALESSLVSQENEDQKIEISKKEEADDEDIDLNKMVNMMLKDINDSATKEDSDIVVKKEKKQEIPDNNSKRSVTAKTESDITKLSSTLQEIEGVKGDTNNSNNPLKEEKRTNSSEKKAESTTPKSTNSSRPKKIEKKSVVKNLYITPIQKTWVGIIYIDDLSKKDFLLRANRKLKLDQTRDQIILVGHNKFKIFHNNREKPFGSKKMVRFLYQNGNLREINKQEYLDLSAGVHW